MTQYGRGKAWTNVRPGMYSAWNWKDGQYDYYQAPGWSRMGYGDEVKTPVPAVLSGGVGEDPDQSGHVLPRSARHVGSGPEALGVIVHAVEGDRGWRPWARLALGLVGSGVLFFVIGKLLGPRRWEEDFDAE